MIAVRRNICALAAPLALLGLAACGSDEPETFEAGVTDESGELIVTDPETPAVDVDLPEVEMTNVPADEADAATDEPTPAATAE